MKSLRILVHVAVSAVVLALASRVRAAESVSVASLLTEMTDYAAVARWPDPPYTCKQASSYDRASKTPDDPEGWFGNHDQNQFIRIETVEGRTEKVMMDVDGPGAIVRFWLTCFGKKGAIRIYLDGAARPTIVVPSYDFTNNNALPAGSPLLTAHPGASPKGRGGNTLYLPIPYASHCKVTWEEDKAAKGGPRYYQINYRTYPNGTKVETFKPGSYDRANQMLAHPPTFRGAKKLTLDQAIEPGKEASLTLPGGPAAVRTLELQANAGDLRTLVLRAEFDDEPTIWCPVGDFFGSGVGLNALQSWYRTVTTDGVLKCRWVMPYQKTARLTLLNLGKKAVTPELTARVGDWTWDDRSLHFRANWRQQFPIPTRPKQDWNYITATGQGIYVGDSLVVLNPRKLWWGEGDEKIFVDAESFPSHFGTGTEDYYNYSWGDPNLFQTPFANQVRCDGPQNYGYSVVTRTRSLDAIPFTKSLRFDIEVWHSLECKVGYAATTYWYARPGGTSNRQPTPEEVVRELPEPKIGGAIEAEALKVVEITGGKAQPQDMTTFGDFAWSGGQQLFWRGGKVGAKLTLEFPVAKSGHYMILVRPTMAKDYGIVQCSLDGQLRGGPIDLYQEAITAAPLVSLGGTKLTVGAHRLTLTIIGRNPKSLEGQTFVGLDYLRLNRFRARYTKTNIPVSAAGDPVGIALSQD